MDRDLIEMLSMAFHTPTPPTSPRYTYQEPEEDPQVLHLEWDWQPEPPLPQPLFDVPAYSRPNPILYKDACAIWSLCGFQHVEFEYILDHALAIWAEENTQGSTITWVSETGNRYTWASLAVFVKWFKITCGAPIHHTSVVDEAYFQVHGKN